MSRQASIEQKFQLDSTCNVGDRCEIGGVVSIEIGSDDSILQHIWRDFVAPYVGEDVATKPAE